MATKQQEKQHSEPEKEGEKRRDAAIANHVLTGLGKPADLLRVQVRQLWQDHYRVNVLVGANLASGTVAHSYFLTADGAGHITDCNPKIAKRY